MLFVLGLILLVAGLLISVALHELGHMIPAKKFGAIVPEYWIGFGPTLWKTKRGDTIYGVKGLPLGGYVRILGMFPPEGSGKRLKADGNPTLAQMARQDSQVELDEARRSGSKGKAFYELSTPKKLVVMLGGPLMNLVLAILLIAIVIMGIGWSAPSTVIAEVNQNMEGSASPAADAGVQAGDQVVAWDGVPVSSWLDFQNAVSEAGGRATLSVERSGEVVDLEITPGLRADGSHYVGVVSLLQREKGSVGDVASTVWMQATMTGKAILALPVNLYNLTRSFFTGEERDPNGVVSVVGVARMAGEITSAPAVGEATTTSGIPSGMSFLDRAALMLSLLGALNIALFVFNLIPLPPLDGGHVAGALWGGIKNAGAKVRGKPKPKPADTARMVPLSYGVFVVLMVMTVILVVADTVKPITFA